MTTKTTPKVVAMRVQGAWTDGVRTETQVRQFAPLVMDEPPSLGGKDTGPNPMEYVLAAFIGCASVMLAVIAPEQNFTYSAAEFDLKGTLDVRGLEGAEGVRPYFDKVVGTVRVTTNDAQGLYRVAEEVERRCPVYTMLEAADVELAIEWEAVEA